MHKKLENQIQVAKSDESQKEPSRRIDISNDGNNVLNLSQCGSDLYMESPKNDIDICVPIGHNNNVPKPNQDYIAVSVIKKCHKPSILHQSDVECYQAEILDKISMPNSGFHRPWISTSKDEVQKVNSKIVSEEEEAASALMELLKSR